MGTKRRFVGGMPILVISVGLMVLAGTLVVVTPALAGNLPATGQTTAFQADKNDGVPNPVDVPDDGTLERGATLHYNVLKDGTIKDVNTGLIWEVKVAGSGCLHCVNDTYVWSGNGSQKTIWDWLDDLNASNYARHNDWRIPNVRELQSIVDYGRCDGCDGGTAAIDPIFGLTSASEYWSSTTYAIDPSTAWSVDFFDGDVGAMSKSFVEPGDGFVRAVRGGSK